MKYFSLFSGIGGFDLALNELGHTCVGYSEIDKYASWVYRFRFGDVKNYGDATKIGLGVLPDFDILCAGFPCQAFSIAGKREGFGDTRGTLFYEIVRILSFKRPNLILLENVKGLLNHKKGETFRVILQALEELGYNIEWMVLNSKFHGVPQNRERIFIIGSLGRYSRGEVLPFGEDAEEIQGLSPEEEEIISSCITTENAHMYGNTVTPRQTEAIAKAQKTYTFKSFDGSSKEKGRAIREHKEDNESSCLTSQMGTGGNNIPMIYDKHKAERSTCIKTDTWHGGGKPITKHVPCLDSSSGSDYCVFYDKPMVMNLQKRDPDRPSLKKRKDAGLKPNAGSGTIGKEDEAYCLDVGANQGVARCLDANMHKGITPEHHYEKNKRNIIAMRSYPRTGTKEQDGDRFQNIEPRDEDVSNTLTNIQKDNLVGEYNYGKLRRLTPVECERLQGFPDDWTRFGLDDKNEIVKISDTQRYKQLGNAVTTNVVYEIMKRL